MELSEYKAPPEVDLTIPAPREEIVVEPETVRVPVMLVVAKLEIPETVKAVVEAFCNEVLPETVRRLEIVVEPVMARVEPVLFQRKLPEEAVLEAPVA